MTTPPPPTARPSRPTERPAERGRPVRPAPPERVAVGYGGEVITATEVEQKIMKLSNDLEGLTYDLARHSNTAAEAEVNYKVKFARVRLVARDTLEGHGPGGRVSNDEADDHAVKTCEDEFRAHLIAGAVYQATRDAMFTKGRQLEALRTIAANLRSQT